MSQIRVNRVSAARGRSTIRTSTWSPRACLLETPARIFCFARDEVPGVAEVYPQRIVTDLIEIDADPSARAHVRRLVVGRRSVFNHQGLETVPHRHPQAEMTVLMVVVRKHREHAFVLLDEKRRRPM